MSEQARCALLLCGLLAAAATPARAQPSGCALVPDERIPTEKILRCGDSLTIRNTPGAQYRVIGEAVPSAVQLDQGALMLEFTPTAPKTFQIMTPHAIAAVRGTRWVVDVTAKQTATLVLAGSVAVHRRRGAQSALLHAGEGVTVSATSGPVKARRWAKRKVDALLRRFGL